EVFGIDCDDDALMTERSWRWLHSRVLSLLDRPSQFVFYPTPDGGTKASEVPSTRVGRALRPPKFE
ncbi:MAG TPA: hypothetical protein VFH56_00275, partial [Acidimicrobiales bacterium]|nr:hypothetical protein [Acidimicrobiales bacterium]